MKAIKPKWLVLAALSGFLGTAGAAEALCGDTNDQDGTGAGLRVASVDPGLVNGFCYTQTGNLQNADISNLGLTLIEKDVINGLDGGPLLTYALNGTPGDATSGEWTIALSVWGVYEQIFLGFHFGGGGRDDDSNPDSFIVELARADTTGDFALVGLNGATIELNGLSNIYLIGDGVCRTDCGGNVPEPVSLALVGAGLLGLAASGRRKA